MPVQTLSKHGNEITDVQLKQMLDKGIFLDLTPTFYGGFFLKITESSIVMLPAVHDAELSVRLYAAMKRYDDLVQRVLKSGVKFAAGSDMCWSYPGQDARTSSSIATFVNLGEARTPAS